MVDRLQPLHVWRFGVHGIEGAREAGGEQIGGRAAVDARRLVGGAD